MLLTLNPRYSAINAQVFAVRPEDIIFWWLKAEANTGKNQILKCTYICDTDIE